ncbi:MAG: endonuclease [Frankiales bacterium]|nr:endonuclease [Frankiales bacterium]
MDGATDLTDVYSVSNSASIKELKEAPPAAESLDALEAKICRLAAQISVATAQLLICLGEFDQREGWSAFGVKSCAHWLSWRCHVGVHAAREQVRVARALRELPLICAEFAAGRLSYAKVRALTRVAEPDSEADLVELALAATAAQTERTVRGWRRAEALAADRPNETERRYFTHHFDEDGMLVLRARMGPEEGALFLAALEESQERAARAQASIEATALKDAVATSEADGDPDGRPSAGPSAALAATSPGLDGLVAMAKSTLNGDRDPARDPDTQLVVHLDAAVLQRTANAGLAAYRHGGTLTAEQARRLACDSKLLVMLSEGRDVLDVGKATRAIPASLRRALWARDKGCVMPGCTERRRRKLQAHHVWHWADGGPTCLDNLVSLCNYHHHAIHDRGYAVVVAATGGFDFYSPQGILIPAAWSASPTTLTSAAESEPALPMIDHEQIPTWKGESFDLDYVVSTLLDLREDRRRRQAEFHTAYQRQQAAA